MTGDVEEEYSLLQISQLDDAVSSNNRSITVSQPANNAFIGSTMAVEDACIYTAAISTDLTGNFPEGSVLQIMPDSGIVAVTVKNLPGTNESSVVFKDSTFSIENTHNSLSLPTLLTESNHNSVSQTTDVPVCPEENIDIDLSFLNEAEESSAINDSKCLNENAEKDLQHMITAVSSHPLTLLQNNLSLSDSDGKPSQEQEQSNTESCEDANDPQRDIVMIDVTKPIQLSQNSLIMVNGQKCILQQDPQTGQVVAYPVKEQERPRKRRGRPRKKAMEQESANEIEQTENCNNKDTENASEEEREKGLLEVVNDDGSLVRRSSRKRKKAKTLKDYETGNLKQELGSDLEDSEFLDDNLESFNRKRKARGPGRPRKYVKIVENVSETNLINGTKRQRGRPRKIMPDNEPTQAFLVQTADGQTLMMQVPLSSIPPGITLQEMAQEIANKLNLGLNHANDAISADAKNIRTKEVSEIHAETVGNIVEIADSISEPALQDHSVGSTTNFTAMNVEISNNEENSNIADNACQSMIDNINQIIGDTICESEEIILESENCTKDVTVQENISGNQSDLNVLEVSQCSEDDNFCINLPSAATPIDSTSMYCNLDHLTDHDFCLTRSNVIETAKENIDKDHSKTCETSSITKDVFLKNNIMPNNTSFQVLLQKTGETELESENNSIQTGLKCSNSNISDELAFKVNKLTGLIIGEKASEKQYTSNQIPDSQCSDKIAEGVAKTVTVDAKISSDAECLLEENILENVECTSIIKNDYLNMQQSIEPDSSANSPAQCIKSDILNSENQSIGVVLVAEKTACSSEVSISDDKISVSNPAAKVIPVPGKSLPMHLPVQFITGSKKCKICQMPYFTDEEIIEHFKDQHPKCICTECNYMNEHPYVIKRHAFRHTNHGCVCKLCNKRYKDFYILKMHIKMVHLPPDVLYACEICEKKFTRKAHLKRHLRIHAPVRQYHCPHCDYKGCEKSDITKHLLIHEEPKFKCEICGKAFRHVKNKELHLKRHSGQRDYKCAACGFFGYTYTDIRKHIERRHSISCSQCKLMFTDNEQLWEHRKTGLCQMTPLDQNSDKKVLEIPSSVSKESILTDEIPFDILDQPEVTIDGECSEKTFSALPSEQIVMTSADGLVSSQNSHLIVEGIEDNNVIIPDNLSVITIEKDSNQMITFITTDGKNLSLPLKSCPTLPVECITSITENPITESLVLSKETETVS